MAHTSDFRNGTIIPEGYVLEKTFMAGDKVEEVRLNRRQCQFL